MQSFQGDEAHPSALAWCVLGAHRAVPHLGLPNLPQLYLTPSPLIGCFHLFSLEINAEICILTQKLRAFYIKIMCFLHQKTRWLTLELLCQQPCIFKILTHQSHVAISYFYQTFKEQVFLILNKFCQTREKRDYFQTHYMNS